MKSHAALRLRPPTPKPKPVKDWGVAWFGNSGTTGHCLRCQRVTWVWTGYNGGAHMGQFCGDCMSPVRRREP